MPRVILVCGSAGSGKSTYARHLEREGYRRLSFDEQAWSRGYVSHPLTDDAAKQIHDHLQHELVEQIRAGSNVVVDTSFWSEASRQDYRRLLEPLGIRPVVHYLDTPREVVLERLSKRSNQGPHDIAVPRDRAIAYLDGFEVPTPQEGPLVIVRAPVGPLQSGG